MGCNCGCGGKSQTKKWDLEPKFSDLKKGDKVEIVGYNEGDARYKSKRQEANVLKLKRV